MAIGTTTAIVLGLAALGTTAVMAKGQKRAIKSQERIEEARLRAQREAAIAGRVPISQAPTVLPATAKVTAAEEITTRAKRRRRAATIMTGPRGILEPAPVGRKVLLGE